ncbi:MAG: HEAT repeat domain-containing protein, partial [Candidatus Eisenbacteria bacterium]
AAALLEPAQLSWLPAAFYIWTGSQALLLLSHFWISALDAWDSQRARRIFPLLTGAGLVGGIAGGALAGWGVERLGATSLLWILCTVLVVVRILTLWLSVKLPVRPLVTQGGAGTSRWKLLQDSAYLRYLAIALGLAVVVATLVDFQFKYFAQQAHPNPDDLAAFLGRFYAGFHALALVIQLGVAGWLLRRLGIGAASGLQPLTMLLFGVGLVLAPIWPVALAMRWVQGIAFQTLGKSSSEIYFMAIRPPERRQIKPALDVVVERGADALAGILLLLTFQVLGVDVRIIAALTAVAAIVWIVMLYRLHREYARAFRLSLAAPWAEPDNALQSLRVPGALEALIEAIGSQDPRQASIALRFAARARRPKLAPAVRAALDHPSPRVRTEAVRAAVMLGLTGEDERVRAFMEERYEPLQRVALEYLLTHGKDAPAFARLAIDSTLDFNDDGVVDRHDATLRDFALDFMADKPALAHGAITLDWVDRRIALGTIDALRDACRGLAPLTGPEAAERLGKLLAHDEPEVRRAALRALARRPEPGLLDTALSHLDDHGLRLEAQDAIVAYGQRAVPPLARLARESPNDAIRTHAAAALGRIGSLRARRVLLEMARSGDPSQRFEGFRNLNRVRVRTGRRQLSRRTVRRMFLREIRDYRIHGDLAAALPVTGSRAVELLRAAYIESADRALARACRALACYHWPAPLEGAYEGLRSGSSREAASRALEFLGSLLPAKMFHTARSILEARLTVETDDDVPVAAADLPALLDKAMQSDDPWIRAIAARAAKAAPGVDTPEPKDDEERRMMTEVEKVIHLRGIDLFKQAGSRQLMALAAFVREIPMFKGQTIYQETDHADALYVVVEGGMRLTAGDKVSEIASGEAFGTWALVDDSARGQRADCIEDGQLLALAREDFYDFASGDAQLLKELVRVLAARLKELVAERPDEARVEGEGAVPAAPEAAEDPAAIEPEPDDPDVASAPAAASAAASALKKSEAAGP